MGHVDVHNTPFSLVYRRQHYYRHSHAHMQTHICAYMYAPTGVQTHVHTCKQVHTSVGPPAGASKGTSPRAR